MRVDGGGSSPRRDSDGSLREEIEISGSSNFFNLPIFLPYDCDLPLPFALRMARIQQTWAYIETYRSRTLALLGFLVENSSLHPHPPDPSPSLI